MTLALLAVTCVPVDWLAVAEPLEYRIASAKFTAPVPLPTISKVKVAKTPEVSGVCAVLETASEQERPPSINPPVLFHNEELDPIINVESPPSVKKFPWITFVS